MQRLKIERGARFGRLTVIKELNAVLDGNRPRRVFKLKCDCGNTHVVKLIALTTGNTRSCGCLFLETVGNAHRTHGKSGTPTYQVWENMLKRCRDAENKSYVDYGERGIKVCKRWQKFENFFADMGERPSDKHEISRIDNDGDYRPGNVEWTTDGTMQCRNRRKQKNASSQFKGVDWWDNQAWRARITIRGEVRQLGLFYNEEDAARAYDKVARRYRRFVLNFPTEEK